MEKNPRYIFYIVASTIEAASYLHEATTLNLEVAKFDAIGEKLYPGYSWVEIEHLFYGPLFDQKNGVSDDYRLTLFHEPTLNAAKQAASTYVHWAFKLGFLDEATAIKQGLLRQNFWSPLKEEC